MIGPDAASLRGSTASTALSPTSGVDELRGCARSPSSAARDRRRARSRKVLGRVLETCFQLLVPTAARSRFFPGSKTPCRPWRASAPASPIAIALSTTVVSEVHGDPRAAPPHRDRRDLALQRSASLSRARRALADGGAARIPDDDELLGVVQLDSRDGQRVPSARPRAARVIGGQAVARDQERDAGPPDCQSRPTRRLAPPRARGARVCRSASSCSTTSVAACSRTNG